MTTDKKKLRELAGAATSGEWIAEKNCVYTLIHDGWKKGVEQFRNFITITCYISKQGDRERDENANAAFIAAANPDTVNGLLDEIERLREALEKINDLSPPMSLSGSGVNKIWFISNEALLGRKSNPDDAEVG